MAVLKIFYASADYEKAINGDLPLNTFLKQVLKGDASAQIIEHLTQYHSQNGDTCQIDDFDISNASINTDKNSGQVVINYLIQYHYGCADITRSAKDHETWRFDIDQATHTLLLYMPDYEVRSTADEF